MTYYAVSPVRASEYCFLIEAAYWIAVQRFPVGDRTPLKRIDFDSGTYIEPWVHDPWFGQLLPDAIDPNFEELDEHECSKLGIQPMQLELRGVSSSCADREYSTFDNSVSVEDPDKDVPDLFFDLTDAWVQSRDAAMNHHKTNLLLKLQTGEIKAVGHLCKKNAQWSQQRLDEQHREELKSAAEVWPGRDSMEVIPQLAWDPNEIVWPRNSLVVNEGVYRMIQICTDDLFAHFPPDADRILGQNLDDERRLLLDLGKGDVLKVEALQKRAAGRPPIPANKVFHEIIKRIMEGKFNFAKQDSEVQHLKEWAASNGIDIGGDTWLKGILRPIYAANFSKDKN